MTVEKEILDSGTLKGNPFTVPQGYFDDLEEKLAVAVNPSEKEEHSWTSVFKPALMLACTFAAIFGMGYGFLRLTGTYGQSSSSDSEYGQLGEDHFLTSSLIMDYLQADSFPEESPDEDEIVEYLEHQLDMTDIADFFAQNE